MKNIHKVKLFVNQNVKSRKISHEVENALLQNGFQITEEDYDLGIAIGGDGSFLRMIKSADFNPNIFYVGINAGTLGFAQDISVEEIDSFIQNLKKGDFTYEEVGIGEASITTEDGESTFHYLNEMVIRDEELNVVNADIYIDDVLLENFAGDGVLTATSFGSTAYNLSFGGSLVYNTFHTLQLTPLAPIHNKSYHTLRNSLILPENKSIRIIPTKKESNYLVIVDGDNTFYNHVESIKTSICHKTIKLIRKKDYNFIQKINDKFLK